MKKQKLFILATTVSLVMMAWTIQAAGGESVNAEKEAVYATLIDRYAAGCDHKSMLRYSRSANLRQKAEISCLKAAYLRNYKDKIIQHLIEKDVKAEMYKIQYIVNSMFYDLIRREAITTRGVTSPAGLAVVNEASSE